MNDILDKFVVYGTVKVGERGQVVIPSKARKEFDIKSGDLLLVIKSPGPNEIGLGLIKADLVKGLLEKVMKGIKIRDTRRTKQE